MSKISRRRSRPEIEKTPSDLTLIEESSFINADSVHVDNKVAEKNSTESELTKSNNSSLLVNQPSAIKWKNWYVRSVMSIVMVSAFMGILTAGPLWVVLLVIMIQTMVYREVISIAYNYTRNQDRVPWFRSMNWYLLGTTNYFLYGESIIQYRTVYLDQYLLPLAQHHRFISFMLYCIGFVLFVINLKPSYRYQLSMFAWTHMALYLIIFTSHFTINNIFEGLIWFVVPVSLVICNDVMAYIFGFFFGRTPLIQLSPKKTWEGFMGALITTLIFAFFFTGLVAQFPYMTCPVNKLTTNAFAQHSCSPNLVFVPHEYKLPPPLMTVARWLVWREVKTVWVYPVQFHSLALAMFASVIAPFGGLFASGVKRAFKIKDYGVLIPGHGGVTDRMDCKLFMCVFSDLL
ncbi:phosphatidate cytidylyltransferase [Nowakowskiella sp. JEL0078]|nr:phosphatidate cytidylyltransferase [Nowakowskiella sp. JEL0078]